MKKCMLCDCEFMTRDEDEFLCVNCRKDFEAVSEKLENETLESEEENEEEEELSYFPLYRF